MFSRHKSKKVSETGDWVDDSDSPDCLICKEKFTLTRRRHHCRKCGRLCCAGCSSHRMYLDISRSGKAKRVCDECFKSVMGEGDGKEDDAAVEGVTEGVAGVDVSGEEVVEEAKAPEKKSYSVMEIPEVTDEEAVANLDKIDFEGQWSALFQFLVVDIGSQRKDAVVSGIKVGSFAGAGAGAAVVGRGRGRGRGGGRGGKARRASINTSHVREGSRLRANFDLTKKGGSYFNGNMGSFGQFGKEGKITGSLQRISGKVSLQVQTKSFGTTTSFNLVGQVTADGQLVGTFSGCEISKSAGSVSGVFKASPDSGASDDDSDDGLEHDLTADD